MVYDTFVMAGPTTHLVLREEDVVKLELEFLQNRDLHISQVTLERETGVINGHFSGNDYVNTFFRNNLSFYYLIVYIFANCLFTFCRRFAVFTSTHLRRPMG